METTERTHRFNNVRGMINTTLQLLTELKEEINSLETENHANKLFEELKGRNYCIHCITEKEAEKVCLEMANNGMTWCNGESYIGNVCYEAYGEDTVYYPNKGRYGQVNRVHPECRIFEFTDLFEEFFYTYAELEESAKFNAMDNLCKAMKVRGESHRCYDLTNSSALFDREGKLVKF